MGDVIEIIHSPSGIVDVVETGNEVSVVAPGQQIIEIIELPLPGEPTPVGYGAGRGWALYRDESITELAPLSVGTTPTTLTLTPTYTLLDYLPGGESWWHDGAFFPPVAGATYTIRVSMFAKAVLVRRSIRGALVLEGGVIAADASMLLADPGVPELVVFDFNVYVTSQFVTNGATVEISSDDEIVIWRPGVLIIETGRPT